MEARADIGVRVSRRVVAVPVPKTGVASVPIPAACINNPKSPGGEIPQTSLQSLLKEARADIGVRVSRRVEAVPEPKTGDASVPIPAATSVDRIVTIATNVAIVMIVSIV